jgi:ABC-type phosphate transport system substrate-binding protein
MNGSRKLIYSLFISMLILPHWGHTAVAEVVVITTAGSTVDTLSKTHIANIFLGRNHYLDDQLRVIAVDQAEGSAARKEFYEFILDWTPANLKAHWSKMIFTGRGKPPRQLSSDNEVKALVAENPGAIGYIQRTNVDSTVKILKIVR